MSSPSPRLAVRALIVQSGRLLLVNAWADDKGSDLWCAPGGGVERGSAIPDNLIREVREETGLTVSVGPLAMVNEFHDPAGTFHQVDLYFRCQIVSGDLSDTWTDPAGIVTRRRFFLPKELATIRLKPDSLPKVAFGADPVPYYDPLEPIIR